MFPARAPLNSLTLTLKLAFSCLNEKICFDFPVVIITISILSFLYFTRAHALGLRERIRSQLKTKDINDFKTRMKKANISNVRAEKGFSVNSTRGPLPF